MPSIYSVIVMLVLILPTAIADIAVATPTETAPPAENVSFNPTSVTFNVYLGGFAAEDEPQFVGIRNQYALGIGLSVDLASSSWLGMDFEMFYVNRDYTTPLSAPIWGTVENDTSVQTTALLVGMRAFVSTQSPWQAYVSAGLGYFYTRMVVYGSLFGLPGYYEDTDYSFDFYYGAGLVYRFGSWGLSLDFRHFELDGEFAGFGINHASLGGDLYLLGWRYHF